MTITVLDSTDTAGILADAGIELEKPDDAVAVTNKKVDAEAEKKDVSADAKDSDDDVEGDDGLTPREKRELTEKMQKAIGKRHREKKEAEEFAAAQYNERRMAEQRAETLEKELEQLRVRAQPEKQVEQKIERPDRINFSTDSEYIDAMIQFGIDTRLKERAEAEAKQAAQRAQEQLIETAKSRIAKAIELVPDYEQVVDDANILVPNAIAGYMQKSELFAEIAYHLAKNPDILTALSKIPPDEQLVKLGKIEANLKPFGSKDDDKKSSQQDDQIARSSKDTTDLSPSKARKDAPVITPLNGTGAAGMNSHDDINIRDAISSFAKKNQVNFNLRKRH
jgi:hypothetical protein